MFSAADYDEPRDQDGVHRPAIVQWGDRRQDRDSPCPDDSGDGEQREHPQVGVGDRVDVHENRVSTSPDDRRRSALGRVARPGGRQRPAGPETTRKAASWPTRRSVYRATRAAHAEEPDSYDRDGQCEDRRLFGRACDEVRRCPHQSDAGCCYSGAPSRTATTDGSAGGVPAGAASGPTPSYSSVPSGGFWVWGQVWGRDDDGAVGCGSQRPGDGRRAARCGGQPARRSHRPQCVQWHVDQRSAHPARPPESISRARGPKQCVATVRPTSRRRARRVEYHAVREIVHEFGAGTTQRLGDRLVRSSVPSATTRTLSATVPERTQGAAACRQSGRASSPGSWRCPPNSPRGATSSTTPRRRATAVDLPATTRADQRHHLERSIFVVCLAPLRIA